MLKMSKLKYRIAQIMETPFGYRLLRGIINMGDLTKLISKHLKINNGESVIDVGCGTGDFCRFFKGKYLGVDINKNYLKFARKKYGSEDRRFISVDVTQFPFQTKFDIALFINIMHHLDEKQSLQVMKSLSKIADKAFIVDLLPGKTAFQKLLCWGDGGKFIRGERKQIELIEKYFEIIKKERIISNSRSAIFNVYTCKTRID